MKEKFIKRAGRKSVFLPFNMNPQSLYNKSVFYFKTLHFLLFELPSLVFFFNRERVISLSDCSFIFVRRKSYWIGSKEFVFVTKQYFYLLSQWYTSSATLQILIYTFVYIPLMEMRYHLWKWEINKSEIKTIRWRTVPSQSWSKMRWVSRL